MLALRLHHQITETLPDRLLLSNGTTVMLLPKLNFFCHLDKSWQNSNDLKAKGFPVALSESLLAKGIIELGCGDVVFPSVVRLYYIEQFSDRIRHWPLHRWLDVKVPQALIWFGLPYESPRELHGSTSAGCAAVIDRLIRQEQPVFGIFPTKIPTTTTELQLSNILRCFEQRRVTVGVIGGDHRVTWTYLRTLSLLYPSKCLVHVQMDAHHDLYKCGKQPSPLSPANFNLDLLRNNVIDHLVVLGVRDSRSHIERARVEGFSILDTWQDLPAHASGTDAHWHLSIDLDILDPSLCPGVTNPLPGGWTWSELETMLTTLFKQRVPNSLSIVETTNADAQTLNHAAELCIKMQSLYQYYCGSRL